jgi:hypothetical protein
MQTTCRRRTVEGLEQIACLQDRYGVCMRDTLRQEGVRELIPVVRRQVYGSAVEERDKLGG